jgi:hypothetical protein
VYNCNFRLYYNIFKRSYGELSGDAMLSSLHLMRTTKRKGQSAGRLQILRTPSLFHAVPSWGESIQWSLRVQRLSLWTLLGIVTELIAECSWSWPTQPLEDCPWVWWWHNPSLKLSSLQDCSSSRAFFQRTHFFADESSVHKWWWLMTARHYGRPSASVIHRLRPSSVFSTFCRRCGGGCGMHTMWYQSLTVNTCYSSSRLWCTQKIRENLRPHIMGHLRTPWQSFTHDTANI